MHNIETQRTGITSRVLYIVEIKIESINNFRSKNFFNLIKTLYFENPSKISFVKYPIALNCILNYFIVRISKISFVAESFLIEHF